jgi:hypothetical protein
MSAPVAVGAPEPPEITRLREALEKQEKVSDKYSEDKRDGETGSGSAHISGPVSRGIPNPTGPNNSYFVWGGRRLVGIFYYCREPEQGRSIG